MRAARTPLADTVRPTPYRVLQTLFDAAAPPGLRYYWRSSFLTGLTAEAIATVADCARRRLSPKSKVFIEFLGGAFARVPREAAVFDHRESRYNLLIIGAWDDPADDEANRQWARETWQAMQPHASERVYVNYLGTRDDELVNRLPAAYGPDKYERLVALKTKYDPRNLFHLNQNIPPRAAE